MFQRFFVLILCVFTFGCMPKMLPIGYSSYDPNSFVFCSWTAGDYQSRISCQTAHRNFLAGEMAQANGYINPGMFPGTEPSEYATIRARNMSALDLYQRSNDQFRAERNAAVRQLARLQEEIASLRQEIDERNQSIHQLEASGNAAAAQVQRLKNEQAEQQNKLFELLAYTAELEEVVE